MGRNGAGPLTDVSPQLENGFTRLANEIIEALMRTNLSAYQTRILWAIWRETYGYHKKQDWISHTQLVKMTGLRKQHVYRTLRELLQRNIVTKAGYYVGFNKNYTQWRELPKRVTVTSTGYKVTDTGYRSNQSGRPQKKKILKKVLSPKGDMSPEASGNGNCPHQKIVESYHKHLPMCPRVIRWTPARAGHLATRWKEDKERQDPGWWDEFFGEWIAKSDFLTGKVSPKNGGRPFLASLDWIVKSENFTKILEGQYNR